MNKFTHGEKCLSSGYNKGLQKHRAQVPGALLLSGHETIVK